MAPYSIIRDFCINKKDYRLGIISVTAAYESYFSNLGSKFAHTIAVTDLTLDPWVRAPFLPRRDRFERWYAANRDNEEYRRQAEAVFTVNRAGVEGTDRERAILARIKAAKAQGRKIVCAFGKVPVDLCVPYDGGPAHADMADWITHTVEVCGGADNILLLVKPHPHELRPEIALDLVEGFTDLIATEVKDNVMILGHRDINAHALAPHLDLAVLYNGSSGLELTAQGVPVMMCAHFGRLDYPVDLIYPESRAQYAAYLRAGAYRKPDAELRRRAAFMITYMGTGDVSFVNDYAFRPVTNDKIGVPRWKWEKVERLLREGDPEMARVARRIVGKFEGPEKGDCAHDKSEQAGGGHSVVRKRRVAGRGRTARACSTPGPHTPAPRVRPGPTARTTRGPCLPTQRAWRTSPSWAATGGSARTQSPSLSYGGLAAGSPALLQNTCQSTARPLSGRAGWGRSGSIMCPRCQSARRRSSSGGRPSPHGCAVTPAGGAFQFGAWRTGSCAPPTWGHTTPRRTPWPWTQPVSPTTRRSRGTWPASWPHTTSPGTPPSWTRRGGACRYGGT